MTFNTHWVIVCDMVIGPMNVVEIELKLDLIRLSSKVMPAFVFLQGKPRDLTTLDAYQQHPSAANPWAFVPAAELTQAGYDGSYQIKRVLCKMYYGQSESEETERMRLIIEKLVG